MDRLSILVCRLVKVPLVGRFMPVVGGIGRLVESPLMSPERHQFPFVGTDKEPALY